MALQGDGKIVAVGYLDGAGSGSDSDFALARYNPNGSLDTSFSGDGKQTTDFGGVDDWAKGVALQADGKIVVVGEAVSGCDFALARYNPNGSLDTSFSGDGKQTTDFGGIDRANGVALQANGKIVAVGRRPLATSRSPATTQRLARHELLRGRQADDRLRGLRPGATGVALQGDGKIVVVGTAASTGTFVDFALARYNPNGSLDTSFSGDGKQTTDFGGSDRATGVALQGDGKIVAVGSTTAGGR